MRLDKLVASAAGIGRAAARRHVTRGQVTVNGARVRDPARKVVAATDTIMLGGDELSYREHVYVMLNKPIDYVCTSAADPRTILALLPDWLSRRELFAVGRLDMDATGLVLLTDDGQWSHDLTSPRRTTDKLYAVSTAEPIQTEAIAAFAAGIQLRAEDEQTLPAVLRILTPTTAELVLHEGRYHQVLHMFAALGNRVTALHRTRIGTLTLDPALAPGQWRELTPNEVTLRV